MKLYKMIEIYLKYENIHTIRAINGFIYINNHVNSCINRILSVSSSIFIFFIFSIFLLSDLTSERGILTVISFFITAFISSPCHSLAHEQA